VHPKGNMAADHISPVIPIDNNWKNTFLGYDWNEVMRNLWCEKEGFSATCKECHSKKTKQENIERRNNK
jgi:5-methylcytosine-specific restriction endonuclease McrA